jgi:hypothetical protein
LSPFWGRPPLRNANLCLWERARSRVAARGARCARGDLHQQGPRGLDNRVWPISKSPNEAVDTDVNTNLRGQAALLQLGLAQKPPDVHDPFASSPIVPFVTPPDENGQSIPSFPAVRSVRPWHAASDGLTSSSCPRLIASCPNTFGPILGASAAAKCELLFMRTLR